MTRVDAARGPPGPLPVVHRLGMTRGPTPGGPWDHGEWHEQGLDGPETRIRSSTPVNTPVEFHPCNHPHTHSVIHKRDSASPLRTTGQV